MSKPEVKTALKAARDALRDKDYNEALKQCKACRAAYVDCYHDRLNGPCSHRRPFYGSLGSMRISLSVIWTSGFVDHGLDALKPAENGGL